MQKPVRTREELFNLISSNSKALIAFGVVRIAVFGSFVRNEATAESDVDFYVELLPEKKTLKNFLGLGDFLEELTQRKVEIVTPQSLSKYIGPYILKELQYVPLAA